MFKILLVIDLALTLILGFTGFQPTLFERSPGIDSQSSESVMVVRNFYADLHTYLQTGEMEPLTKMVAPKVWSSASKEGFFGGESGGFPDYFLALRSACSHSSLQVESITSLSDVVKADVEFQCFADGDISRSNRYTDFFLVVEGRIVDHWSTSPPAALNYQIPWLETPMRVDRPGHPVIASIALWAGTRSYIAIQGPGILMVLSGEVELLGNGLTGTADRASENIKTTLPDERLVVSPGTAIIIPRGQAVVRNLASSTSKLIYAGVSSSPEAAGEHSGDRPNPSNEAEPLLETTGEIRTVRAGTVTIVSQSGQEVSQGLIQLQVTLELIPIGGTLTLASEETPSVAFCLSGSVSEVAAGDRTVYRNHGNDPALMIQMVVGTATD